MHLDSSSALEETLEGLYDNQSKRDWLLNRNQIEFVSKIGKVLSILFK